MIWRDSWLPRISVILSGYRTFAKASACIREDARTDLQSEEQQERFDAVESAVYKVAHEEIVCLWTPSADSGEGRDQWRGMDWRSMNALEEFEQVEELAVDVTADCDWGVDVLYIRLFDQDLARL